MGDRVRGSLSTYVQAFGVVKKMFVWFLRVHFSLRPTWTLLLFRSPTFRQPLFSPHSVESFDRINRAVFSQPRKSIRELAKVLEKEVLEYLRTHSGVDFTLRPARLVSNKLSIW